MAIAGSGGWIPSRSAWVQWDGKLCIGEIAQNKPRKYVYSDVESAAEAILCGNVVQVDTRGEFIPALRNAIERKGQTS